MKYLYLSKYTNPDGNEITYCGDNIKIRVKDKIVNNIFVCIPSDLNIPHVFMIYKILTGHMPNDDAVRDLYAYEILTKLEACYPCVKDILRRDIYNPRICPSSIIVGCDKNGIRISVIYDKYDKRDIYNTAQAYSIGDKRIIDAIRKVYGYNWTKDLSKELSIVFNVKGDNNMKCTETAYISNDIEIHLNKRVINDITVYIPLYVKASDAVKIYDAIIGYGSLRPYEMLDELKEYYPYLKNVDRGEIYNSPIYPKDIDVCGKDKIIAITVKYGHTSTSFSMPNLSKIYSSIYSERYKIYMYLLSTTGKVSFAFKMSPELEEMYKTYEEWGETYKKYVETRPSTENDSKEKATIKVTKETVKAAKEAVNSVFGVPTFEAFDAITDELKDTYIKKNHDYGNSFDKSIDKFGLTAAVVRMNDKMERLSSLMNKDAKVDESIRDTVMDLANYCIMTAMYLDNKKENK